jgi:hypothetical protein
MGRIDKFARTGAKIERVATEDGRSFLNIHERMCNTCFTADALKDTPRNKWKQTVIDHITIRVTMVMYVGRSATDEDVEKTLDSFLYQEILPYSILVIIDYENNNVDRIRHGKRLRNASGLLHWKIEKINEPTGQDGESLLGFDNAVDFIIYKNTATYFTSCNAGFEYDREFIKIIDKMINEDMRQFIAILPDNQGNGMFTQVKLYTDVTRYKGFPFVDTLVKIVRENKQEEYILGYENSHNLDSVESEAQSIPD